jgi:hypothetical protein
VNAAPNSEAQLDRCLAPQRSIAPVSPLELLQMEARASRDTETRHVNKPKYLVKLRKLSAVTLRKANPMRHYFFYQVDLHSIRTR